MVADSSAADRIIRPATMVLFVLLIVAQLVVLPPQSIPVFTWAVTLAAVALLMVTGTAAKLTQRAWDFHGFWPLAAFAAVSGVVFALPPGGLAVALAYFASNRAGERLTSRRHALAVAVIGTVVATLSAWLLPAFGLIDGFIPWWVGLTVGLPVYAGIARQDRTNALAAAREAAAQSQRAAASEARAAALEERGRIAREIHDVLGHSLTGIAMQLDMANALHASDRDDEANGAVLRARGMAVSGMAETRRAIHALREDTLPLPTTIEGLAAASLADFALTGDPQPLSVEMAQAVIRTAQESLTNIRRHAPGAAAQLTLAYEPDRVRLTVADTPAHGGTAPAVAAGEGSGMGLIGMRERAALLGGTLSTGPGPHGIGWIVTLELPL